jgi:hypothetical protein
MPAYCPNCGSERHYNVPATEDCRRHIRADADAYARGRADERADVVAWLNAKAKRLRSSERYDAERYAEDVEDGLHVDAAQRRALKEK